MQRLRTDRHETCHTRLEDAAYVRWCGSDCTFTRICCHASPGKGNQEAACLCASDSNFLHMHIHCYPGRSDHVTRVCKEKSSLLLVTGTVIAKISAYMHYICFVAVGESAVITNQGFPLAGKNTCNQLRLLTQLDGSQRMSLCLLNRKPLYGTSSSERLTHS